MSFRSRGFTLVEVLVAMVLISVMAFASMITLKVSSRTASDTALTTRSTLSYRNIKSGFAELLRSKPEESIKSVYRCVNRTYTASKNEALEGIICDEEAFIDPAKKILIDVTADTVAGTCFFKLTSTFKDVEKNQTIVRVWRDEKPNCEV